MNLVQVLNVGLWWHENLLTCPSENFKINLNLLLEELTSGQTPLIYFLTALVTSTMESQCKTRNPRNCWKVYSYVFQKSSSMLVSSLSQGVWQHAKCLAVAGLVGVLRELVLPWEQRQLSSTWTALPHVLCGAHEGQIHCSALKPTLRTQDSIAKLTSSLYHSISFYTYKSERCASRGIAQHWKPNK